MEKCKCISKTHQAVCRAFMDSHHSPYAGVVVDTSRTRYHVVRAAAHMLGWLTDDKDRDDVPATFYGCPIQSDFTRSDIASTCGDRLHECTTRADNESRETECNVTSATLHDVYKDEANEASNRQTSPVSMRNIHTSSTLCRDCSGDSSSNKAESILPKVVWLDTSVSSARVSGLQGGEHLNHFTGMDVIARKAVLFRRLTFLCTATRALSSDSAAIVAHAVRRFTPLSFSSRKDYAALCAHSNDAAVRASKVYFIIKPGQTCMGKGIRLTRDPASDLTETERTRAAAECVVQEYIARPQLVSGRKFDIRLYVLLTAVSAPQPSQLALYKYKQRSRALSASSSASSFTTTNMSNSVAFLDRCNNNNNNMDHTLARDAGSSDAETSSLTTSLLRGVCLYVHREGLLRLCADSYVAPTDDNCSNKRVHLTNYAVNRDDSNGRSVYRVCSSDQIERGASSACDNKSDNSQATCEVNANGNDRHRSNCRTSYTSTHQKVSSPVRRTMQETTIKHRLAYLRDYVNALPSSEVDDDEVQSDMCNCPRRCCCCGDDRSSSSAAHAETRWDVVWRRIKECVALTMLSGVPVLRRELHGARASSARSGNAARAATSTSRCCSNNGTGISPDWHRCCFELLGFDIMLESYTLQPKLMEVNHSPSLFCDTELDFAVKSAVVADALRLVVAPEGRADTAHAMAPTNGFEQVLPHVQRCRASCAHKESEVEVARRSSDDHGHINNSNTHAQSCRLSQLYCDTLRAAQSIP